ncbi:hypothetical protein SGPA1_30491 [Streptomyces misionensis JCM 4497]
MPSSLSPGFACVLRNVRDRTHPPRPGFAGWTRRGRRRTPHQVPPRSVIVCSRFAYGKKVVPVAYRN